MLLCILECVQCSSLPLFTMDTSLELWQSYNFLNASESVLNDMGKHNTYTEM